MIATCDAGRSSRLASTKRPSAARLIVQRIGLPSSQHRPRPPPSLLPEAWGRPGQQRRQLRVARRERQPGERDQAQRHVAVDVDRQAQVQRLSSSARAPASWPPATSRVPSCTRDQAASQV